MTILKKISMYLGMFIAGIVVLANNVKAAADPDAVAALASSTSAITENKGMVLGFMATIFGIVIVFVVVKRLLGSGKAQIAGAIGGVRRGRR